MSQTYGEWFHEGEEVDDVEITGLEYVRSDVADVTQNAQYEVLRWMLKEDWGTAWEKICGFLRKLHKDISSGEYDDDAIAKRGGIGQPLSEYGSESRSASSLYKGAKYADKHIDGVELSEGSKPKAFYVDSLHNTDLPPTYTAETAEDGDIVDVISVESADQLPKGVELDYEKHCKKVLVEPLDPIIRTMGEDWDSILHSHSQSSLETF